MMREDLKAAERDELVKRHGYLAYDYHGKAMQKDSKIDVAGHRGLVGSALLRRLRAGGYDNLFRPHPCGGSDRAKWRP